MNFIQLDDPRFVCGARNGHNRAVHELYLFGSLVDRRRIESFRVPGPGAGISRLLLRDMVLYRECITNGDIKVVR